MIRRWTPRRFVVLRRARIIASALSIALICTAFFAFSTRKAVALTVNGKSKIVTTYAMSAQRLLEEQNIKIKTHDQVLTSSGEILTNHSTVTVRSAYQTSVTVNGVTIPFWTVATSVDQLIGFFKANEKRAVKITVNLRNIYDKLSGGLSINKEGPVSVICDGKTRIAPDGKLPASSILDSQGIVLGKEDRVTVENDGNKTILRILRVTHGQEKRVVQVPFTTQTITDNNLPEGTRIVQKAGINGEREDVYNVTYVDGKPESATLVSQIVTKPVIDAVVAIGRKSVPQKQDKPEIKHESDTNTIPKNNKQNKSKKVAPSPKPKPKSENKPKPKSEQKPKPQTPAPAPAPAPAQTPAPAPAPAPTDDDTDSMVHATPEQAKLYAKAACAEFGWVGEEWDALVWLWNRESHWRWNAENPSSGAYGIPQALPASKLGDVSRGGGPNWHEDAGVQINWGLNYIKNRYGSPTAAVQHSHDVGWY